MRLQPREAVELESGDEVVGKIFEEATALRAGGRFEEAAKRYEQLLRATPTCSEAVLNLGVCYLKLGHFAQARRLYIQSQSQSLAHRYNYALASLKVGKRYEALSALKDCSVQATGALAEDINWTIRHMETETTDQSFGLDTTESELEFSMIVKSTPKTEKHRKVHSLSLSSKPKNKRNLPRISLFKSVDDYVPGTLLHPVSATLSSKPHPNRYKIQPYRVPFKARTSSISESGFSGRNQISESCLNEYQMEGNPIKRLRRKGSLVEEDLESQEVVKLWEKHKNLGEELRNTAAKMQDDLEKCCDRTILTEESPTSKGSRLLTCDIDVLLTEMTRDIPDRDYNLMVSLVSKLHFFLRFRLPVREEFLRISTILQVKRHEYVFHQGDFGSKVYVVLRGSVQVWRQAAEFGSEPLLVHTLYDGDIFGELSLFTRADGVNADRSASCKAVEETDLLCIAKEEYYRIMVREVEMSLEAKLSVLLQMPFFEGAQQLTLIPLASTLCPAKFKIGDYLLHPGDTPKGLHIIISGRCNVLSEGFSLRSHSSSSASSHLITRSMVSSNPSLAHQLRIFFKTFNLPSLFSKGTLYREQQLKSVLSEKYFFAGRCLRQNTIEPSKFAVVADSAVVTVYIITKEQLSLLGETLTEQLMTVLGKVHDPDCPPNQQEKRLLTDFARWNEYKERVVSRAKAHRR